MSRRSLRWIIAVPVALVVLAVAGTWVYMEFLRPEPAGRLTLEGRPQPPAQAGGSATGVDGTWTVGPGSTAGYRVREILFGQDAVAVGRTENVQGSFLIAGSRVTSGSFTVDMASMTSDQSRRDGQFRGRIMDVARHPTSTFRLADPIDVPAAPPDGSPVSVRATGDLTLRGTTKRVTIPLEAKRSAERLEVAGRLTIVFEEWGIPNPTIGPAQVGDRGELEFLLNFTRSP